MSLGESCDGPKRVLFLRHGESQANVTGRDIPDPLLSDDGRKQARSWADHIGALRVDLVLTSPLRRAVETACIVFSCESTPIEVCYAARELWWHHRQNVLGPVTQLRSLLQSIPRGGDVIGVAETSSGDPSHASGGEVASVARLRQLLAQRPEHSVAVVCHYLLIKELTGCASHNGEFLVCELTANGQLQVTERHLPPGGPVTMW